MNINKWLWRKKRTDKQKGEECWAEKAHIINHGDLADVRPLLNTGWRDSEVTTGMVQQRIVPLIGVTSLSPEQAKEKLCGKERFNPSSNCLSLPQVFQSSNSQAHTHHKTVASLSLIFISQHVKKTICINKYILF